MITGTGLNLSVRASLIVTAARNNITVIESINMARTDERIINATNILTGSNFASLAILRQSQSKKPASAIPSTITIIPHKKMMVAQLTPEVCSDASSAAYQKLGLKIPPIASVSRNASRLRMPTPNTNTLVKAPHDNVT